MFFKIIYRQLAIVILLVAFIMVCKSAQSETTNSYPLAISETAPILPIRSIVPTITPAQPTPAFDVSDYAFPDSIDPAGQYMFYLHGKIIEDQGIPAISPDYGEYEYGAILEALSGYGFVVISEPRPMNTDSLEYARKVIEQVTALLEAGVPANNITVVGASKGAGIAIFVSHYLENPNVNYVILAICAPDTVEQLIQDQISLYGNVLSIYDSTDELAGSCQGLFSFSEGKGISRHEELILNVGTGHGILYKPLDEWITPTIEWARNP
jgi:hypothetical protein